MSREEVQRLDEQGLQAWDNHNIDAFLALCDNSIVWNDVGLQEPIRGKEGVRQYMQNWMTAFPDIHLRRKNTLITDDAAAVELEFEGTHRGQLQGPPGSPSIPPTNKRVTSKGAYFARVRNGKIVEFSAHPDTAGMMMQLGLMPSPATATTSAGTGTSRRT